MKARYERSGVTGMKWERANCLSSTFKAFLKRLALLLKLQVIEMQWEFQQRSGLNQTRYPLYSQAENRFMVVAGN